MDCEYLPYSRLSLLLLQNAAILRQRETKPGGAVALSSSVEARCAWGMQAGQQQEQKALGSSAIDASSTSLPISLQAAP